MFFNMTNTTEMTVARALSELKLLDARIYRAINDATLGTYSVGGKVLSGYNSTEDIEKQAKADYQSAQALIKRRNTVKSAIVKSNAETDVVVAGVKMTRAEAIERKTSISYDKTLLAKMKSVYAHMTSRVDNINEEVKERLDGQLEVLFGREGKPSTQEIENITKTFKDNNEAKLIDPIGLKKQINKLTEEIESFEQEVDHVLNESNTLTRIAIED